MTGDQRADDRAEAIEHPVLRPAAMPWPRPRATKSTRKTMCGTSAHGIEAVFEQQRPDGLRLTAVRCAMRRGRSFARAALLRPVRPADQRQQRGQCAEAIPALRKPCCSSSGTSVPEAATPRPTPAKITPPTMPRLAGEVCGSTTEAASTMMMPPERPARKRQAKNQSERNRRGTGKEGERGEHHHRRAATGPRRNALPRPRQQRAGEIAGEVRRAEIDDVGRAEPFCRNQRRDQRRVGEARQADATSDADNPATANRQ